jgi:predicted SAM-dependent methyltransferase
MSYSEGAISSEKAMKISSMRRWLVRGRTRRPQGSENVAPETIVARYLREIPEGKRGLNLGCGGVTFKEWLNIDAEYPHHVDILWNLREAIPFIPDDTFDAIYSEHFMEHIDRRTALELARDCLRALRSGGHIRIAMPDLDKVLRDYHDDNKHPEVHDEFAEFYGILFRTRGELLDIAMRAWGHTYLYNYEDADLLLKAAGFANVRRVQLNQSDVPLLNNRESRPVEQSGLIVEGHKP